MLRIVLGWLQVRAKVVPLRHFADQYLYYIIRYNGGSIYCSRST